ncbi:metallophosphoesterase [Saccharothrix violaceirubra]|uniref:metallophosphoesterase n=1 Tax=Saccharothrix violaceirubra TaxID=413306 RepID=UPI0028AC09FF|nr:metallophosphoesterase [Saccharothrix violaceirubra]
MLLFVVVLGAVHYYIWRRVVRDTTTSVRGRRIGTVAVVLLYALMMAALLSTRAGVGGFLAWPGYLWLAVAFYLALLLGVLEIPRYVLLRRLAARERAGAHEAISRTAPGTQSHGVPDTGTETETRTASDTRPSTDTRPGTGTRTAPLTRSHAGAVTELLTRPQTDTRSDPDADPGNATDSRKAAGTDPRTGAMVDFTAGHPTEAGTTPAGLASADAKAASSTNTRNGPSVRFESHAEPDIDTGPRTAPNADTVPRHEPDRDTGARHEPNRDTGTRHRPDGDTRPPTDQVTDTRPHADLDHDAGPRDDHDNGSPLGREPGTEPTLDAEPRHGAEGGTGSNRSTVGDDEPCTNTDRDTRPRTKAGDDTGPHAGMGSDPGTRTDIPIANDVGTADGTGDDNGSGDGAGHGSGLGGGAGHVNDPCGGTRDGNGLGGGTRDGSGLGGGTRDGSGSGDGTGDTVDSRNEHESGRDDSDAIRDTKDDTARGTETADGNGSGATGTGAADGSDTGTQAGTDADTGAVATPDVGRRLFLARTLAVVGGVAASGVVGYGMTEALGDPVLKRVPVTLDKLDPRLSGYRIAVVSDIHLGPLLGRAHTERIVRLINDMEVDLVAIVGDLVDGTVEELGDDAAPLRDLVSTHGSFFVTGNHEYYSGAQPWLTELERLGVNPLRNERVTVERAGARFELAGVNDLNGRQSGDGPDFGRALDGRDATVPVVLLAHQPVQAREAAKYGVDLQLSGHTHGGQMFPFHLAVGLQQPVRSGLATVDGTQVYTSNGVGFWGPPVRVGAPPDITSVELHHNFAGR